MIPRESQSALDYGVSSTFLAATLEKARSTCSQATPGCTSLENTMNFLFCFVF